MEVKTGPSAWLWGSCRRTLQLMGWMREQSPPAGQHSADVSPASASQDVFLGQQKSDGSDEPQVTASLGQTAARVVRTTSLGRAWAVLAASSSASPAWRLCIVVRSIYGEEVEAGGEILSVIQKLGYVGEMDSLFFYSWKREG